MTASDWIALAGIALSAFLGWLGYRTGNDARSDAHRLATEAAERASRDARAARLFERRKDVYEEVLDYVYRTEDTVDRTEPLITWPAAPGPPSWPSEDEVRRQNARTAAWGSAELLERLLALKSASQEFQGAVLSLGSKREVGMEKAEDVKDVQGKREAVKSRVKELIDLVNAELSK